MATYELTINDHAAKLGKDASLVSLEIAYAQPRRLTFTAPRSVLIRLGNTVVLTADGTVRFRGLVSTKQPDPMMADTDQYVATDYVDESRHVQMARFRFGAEPYQLAAAFLFKGKRELAEILALATAVYGPELLAKSACAAANSVFSGVGTGMLYRFTATNGGFPDFMNALLVSLPGHTWLWEPDTKLWRIVNVYAAPAVDLSFEDDVLESNPLSTSIEGRYSEVTLYGDPTSYDIPSVYWPLDYAWDSLLEIYWSTSNVNDLPEHFSPRTLDWDTRGKVYRMFHYNPDVAQVDTRFPIELVQKVWLSVTMGVATYAWIAVEILKHDAANGYILSKLPCLSGGVLNRGGNPHAALRGKARPPRSMAMRYTKLLNVPMPMAQAGPDGQMYNDFGIRRELCLHEPEVELVTVERARMILDCYKDPTVTGSVPLAGDMPDWAWNLNARINIKSSRGQTGLDALHGIVTSVRHDFDGGGRTIIELGNDRSRFLGSATV